MAKDKYHDLVRNALIEDGWTITEDPLVVHTLRRTIRIDMAADRLIGAEKEDEKIAVEVKSFLALSRVYEFYRALGQTLYYSVALELDHEEPDRILFLAVPKDVFQTFFNEPVTKEIIKRFAIKILVYDLETEKIAKWIK